MSLRLLQISVILFLLSLGIWTYAKLDHASYRTIPSPLPVGRAFAGNAAIPVEEFEKTYGEAAKAFERYRAAGRRYYVLHEYTDWLSFTLTALITVLAGFWGKPPKSQAEAAGLARGLENQFAGAVKATPANRRLPVKESRAAPGKGLLRVVSVIAALASITIGLSSRLQTENQRSTNAAVELNTALSSARRAWFEAKSSSDALDILSRLREASIRNP